MIMRNTNNKIGIFKNHFFFFFFFKFRNQLYAYVEMEIELGPARLVDLEVFEFTSL